MSPARSRLGKLANRFSNWLDKLRHQLSLPEPRGGKGRSRPKRNQTPISPQLERLETIMLLSAVTWTGAAGDNNWDTANNWSDLLVPGSADDVTINSVSTPYITHAASATDTINSLVSNVSILLSGGTLNVNTTLSDNADITLAGGTLGNATVQSGTLLMGTTGGGTLSNVTLDGNLDLQTNNTATATITNGLTLNGTINIGNNAGSTSGDLSFNGDVNVGGSGKVVFGNDASNQIAFNAGLTLGSAVTILGGSGTITSSVNGNTLINEGLIDAQTGGTVVIDPTGTFTNDGTLTAEGGTVTVNPGSLSNFSSGTLTGGTWSAIDGGALRLIGDNITTNSATLTLSGPSSEIYSDSATTNALAGLAANSSSGNITLENGADFTAAGAFSNSGSLTLDASSFTLSGNNNLHQILDYTQTAGTTLLEGGTLATATGSILINGGNLYGYGTLAADVTIGSSGTLLLTEASPDASLAIEGGLLLDGTIEDYIAGTQANALSGYQQLVINGNFENDGSIVVTPYNSFTPGTFDSFKLIEFNSRTVPMSGSVGVAAPLNSQSFFDGTSLWLLPNSAQFLTVSTTSDGGAGSLRNAITQANSGSVFSAIVFNIPTSDSGYNSGTGVWTIAPASELPSITNPVLLDSTTQPSYAGKPVVDLDGTTAGAASGLILTGRKSTLEGFAITKFQVDGVQVAGTAAASDAISGNYIGINPSGTAAGNATGIYVTLGATDIVIGGTSAVDRNIISGNSSDGVQINGSAKDNIIEGNYIGTNVAGTTALANTSDGIFIQGGAYNNTIGGTAAGSLNVISGNGVNGVQILGAGSSGNVVEGNYIGTNASGTSALANGNGGVFINDGATNNIIGGTTAAARNIISGNGGGGVAITASGTTGNIVEGNYLGTDVTGTISLSDGDGVYITAAGNTIGGSATGAGNLISGNTNYGVYIGGTGGSGNAIEGNFIGTDALGSGALGNGVGIYIVAGANNNIIGGTLTGDRNIISGNSGDGVDITSSGSSGNIVEGNYIGTDGTGSAALANNYGVVIDASATNNTIGGTSAGARNIISGNAGSGVLIQNSGTAGNVVEGNYIGTDVTGNLAVANDSVNTSHYGAIDVSSAGANTIGGSAAGAGNLISGNTNWGIVLENDAPGNLIAGNLIGTNAAGNAALANADGVFLTFTGGVTVGGTTAGARNIIDSAYEALRLNVSSNDLIEGNWIGVNAAGTAALGSSYGIITDTQDDNDTIGGTAAGAGNVISGNNSGIALEGSLQGAFTIQGNLIGTDPTGKTAIGNVVGIDLTISNITIGGTTAAARNIISGNSDSGISNFIPGSDVTGGAIEGNYIGTDITGTVALPNGTGVELKYGTTNFTIGGTAAGAGNLISGNTNDGVEINDSNGNFVEGNSIGTNVAGAALGNGNDGVLVYGGSSNNTIGGTTIAARNIISGNGGDGINVAGSGTTGNTVEGNYIGTDVTGRIALANGEGVVVTGGASGNTIGGVATGVQNVLTENGLLSSVYGIAIDANGDAIVSDSSNNQILRVNPISGAQTVISSGGSLVNPDGIALAASGDIYVAVNAFSSGTPAIVSVNPTTGAQKVISSGGNFVHPSDLAVAPNGDIYVADDSAFGGNGAIFQVNPTTGTQTMLTEGTGASTPSQLAFDAKGELLAVYVPSTGGAGEVDRVDLTTGARTAISSGGLLSNPSGLAVNPDGSLLVTNLGTGPTSPGNIVRVDPTTGAQTVAYSGGSLFSPIELAVAGNGDVYATNYPDDSFNHPEVVYIAANAARNIISGNSEDGVLMSGSGTTGNTVAGNDIGTNSSGTDLLSGEAAWYQANGNANDSAGANNGTVEGGVTYAAGQVGQAFSLNGTNAYIDVPSSPSLTPLSAVTVDAWINLAALPSSNIPTGSWDVFNELYDGGNNPLPGQNSGGAGGYALRVLSNGAVEFYVGTSENQPYYTSVTTAAGVVTPGTFFHVAGTYDSTTGQLSVYVNGVATTVTASGTLNQDPIAVKIGANLYNQTYFNGLIDEPTIYDRALSSSEIQRIYQLGSNGKMSYFGNSSNGVEISGGASGNTIGGITAAARNVISGNSGAGVDLSGSSNNTLDGNYIGTNAAGAAELANLRGVVIENGSSSNTVGGTTAGAGNLISGNLAHGVWVSGTTSDDNLIEGNQIGTDATGTVALGNGLTTPQSEGIRIEGANNTVGGTTAGAGNVIADSGTVGLRITGPGATGNLVEGNFIGTNAAGSSALGNLSDGVLLDAGAANNTIGGTTAASRNVISGNNADGVDITDSGTTGNVIEGNYIGTDASGSSDLATHQLEGISISAGAANNTLGGSTAGAGNVIGGSRGAAVYIIDTGTNNNVVAGNSLGLGVDNSSAIANAFGILIDYSAANTLIGGTTSAARNVVSDNASGIFLAGVATLVEGNYIGTDASGTIAKPNENYGVRAGGAGSIIGGLTATPGTGAGNVISGNGGQGLVLFADQAVVEGNIIGLNAAGNAILGNGLDGIFAEDGPRGGAIGGTAAGARNVISGNAGSGIDFDYVPGVYAQPVNITIQGNYIGTDITGTLALGNSGDGILLDGAASITVGGTTAAARNVISGNSGQGVDLSDSGTTGNTVEGNYIGTDVSGSTAMSNAGNGVRIANGSSSNTIGGTATGAGNVISGNLGRGVYIADTTSDSNLIQGNYIGTDYTGTAPLGNGRGATAASNIRIEGADNTVGGTAAGAGNVIADCGVAGVRLTGTGATDNVVEGNFIGTNLTGTSAIGNQHWGVLLDSGAANNSIGGTTAAARNIISGNLTDGVQIRDAGTTNNTVEGNYIGTDVTGTIALANNSTGGIGGGVDINNASGNVIGGLTATPGTGAGNVISGNGDAGIFTQGTSASNLIEGNLIGTDATGTHALGNGFIGSFAGVRIASPNNTVGGTATGAGNVISANAFAGVQISGQGTVVEGNYIGTDITGTSALGNNTYGIGIGGNIPAGPENIVIGGTSAAARNVIAGNLSDGINISGSSDSGNTVEGNYIGTNAAGTAALANLGNGVTISQAPNNTIGGTTTGAGNLISGNRFNGVNITGTGATGNIVEGNNIGTNPNGGNPLLEGAIAWYKAEGNANDRISSQNNGTLENGVTFAPGEVGQAFQFNGVNQYVDLGNNPAFNVSSAVTIEGWIDPTGAGSSSWGGGIIFNDEDQFEVARFPDGTIQWAFNNSNPGWNFVDTGYVAPLNQWTHIAVVYNNGVVTTYANGVAVNTYNGSGTIARGSNDAEIGGRQSQSQYFAGRIDELTVYGRALSASDVQAIYSAGSAGKPDLGNQGDGVLIQSGASNNIIGVNGSGGNNAAQRNIISGNAGNGIVITGSGTNGNVVAGNYIGTDAIGAAALGNNTFGVEVNAGAQSNVIGTNGDGVNDAAEGNVISGNGYFGVFISDPGTNNNVLAGNFIGTDSTGMNAVPNGVPPTGTTGGGGILIANQAASNRIGTNGDGVSDALERNVISGNSGWDGLLIQDANNNVVAGNYIGVAADGLTALGNDNGMDIKVGAQGNRIGVNTADPDYAAERNIISGNRGDGIDIWNNGTATTMNNVVAGNYIGVDKTGATALGNSNAGISIFDGAQNNIIGGPTAGSGNVISGNAWAGVGFGNVGTTGNVLEGNFIGTNAAGTAAVGNLLSGVVIQFSASGNIVGGTTALARNIISGNDQDGVQLNGSGVTGNVVEGNYIGTNAAGTAALGNLLNGVIIGGSASGNIVGGLTSTPGTGAGNVISGNQQRGVAIYGANNNQIEGNLIGTNAAGTGALANLFQGVEIGLSSTGNTVGGTAAGAGNIISANDGGYGGILLSSGTTQTLVQGNDIGTDITGTAALGNAFDGIDIIGSSNNTIGGTTAAARNVIAGNHQYGTYITNAVNFYGYTGASDDNIIEGDYVGTNAAGTAALGNGRMGIVITGGASGNRVGADGSSAAADAAMRNIISGNGWDGVQITGTGTENNVVAGNYLGTDVTGMIAIPNATDSAGVSIFNGASNNRIGTSGNEADNVGERNVISGNSGNQTDGIFIDGTGTSGNLVAGNYIGVNAAGTAALGNYYGIQLGGSNNTIGGTTAVMRNVIAGSITYGIQVYGNNELIEGNYIGTNAAGTAALGNATGISITTANNTIGGAVAGAGNLISGNSGDGIDISGTGATGNTVEGNYIGTNASGAALGNQNTGVYITSASNNTIGGPAPGQGNTIAHNTGAGVAVVGSTTTGNAVRGNAIYANTGLGIDLGDTGTIIANDSQGHSGPNDFTDYPIITAVTAGPSTLISGNMPSTSAPGSFYYLDFFASTTPNASGHGDAQVYLGSTTVTTDSTGLSVFNADVPGASSAGQYITATATDGSGNTSEFAVNVVPTVANLPFSVGISGPSSMPASGIPVALNSTVSDPQTGKTYTYSWNVASTTDPSFTLPTGTVIDQPNLTFTPPQAGTYIASLSVTDYFGASESATPTTIAVGTGGQLVAINGVPPSIAVNTPLTVSAAVTEPPGISVSNYAWNVTLNGSSYAQSSGATASTFTFTPATAGNYAIILTATNSTGATGSTSVSLTAVTPSVAIQGAPQSAGIGTPITVSAAVNDPNLKGALTYDWSVTSNGTTVASNPTDTTGFFTFMPSQLGSYSISLTVTDAHGDTAAAALVSVQVITQAPAVGITGAPAGALTGTSLSLGSIVTEPAGISTTAYAWSILKNGVPYTPAVSSGAATANFSFTPDAGGLYTVELLITGSNGAVGGTSIGILVSSGTVAIGGLPSSVGVGTPVTATAVPTDPNLNGTLTYHWSAQLTSGPLVATGTGPSFTFTPEQEGSYSISLTANSGTQTIGTATATLAVANVAPTVTISGVPTSPTSGKLITLTGSANVPGSTDTFTFAWSLNGQTTTDTGTSFTFTPAAGPNVVTLTATDTAGGSASTSVVIAAAQAAGGVVVATSGPLVEGGQATLQATLQSPVTDVNYSFAWTVTGQSLPYSASGNGTLSASGTSSSFAFAPPAPGTYLVSVTATGSDGGTASASELVTVANVPPTVTINGIPSSSIAEGTPVNLQANVSDPGLPTDVMSYLWTVTGPENFMLSASAANLNFTPIESGKYAVSLTVTDSSGAAVTTTSGFTVTHVAPVPVIQDAGTQYDTATSTLTVNLTSTVPDPGNDDTFTYAWSAIDQTTGATLATGSGPEFSFTFTGSLTDSLLAALEVKDNDGGDATASVPVLAYANAIVTITDPDIPATTIGNGGTNGSGQTQITAQVPNTTTQVLALALGNTEINASALPASISLVASASNGGDTLIGGAGSNLLFGAANDTLMGGSASTSSNMFNLLPGAGESVQAGGTNNTLSFAASTTGITLNLSQFSGSPTQFANYDGTATDTLTLTGSFQNLVGSAGADNLFAASNSKVFGGGGNDTLTASGISDATLMAGSGNAILSATNSSNIQQFGGSGNATLSSSGGSSIFMQGGSGNTTIASSGGSSITQFGGSGNDSLYTSGGSSIYMQGGSGNTTIASSGGSSITQFGGSGNDSLYTSGGSTIYMQGGAGNATLSSSGGSSITQFGGTGNDSLYSSGGSSIYMQGGTGNATLSSSGGSSITQFGGSGNDSLYTSGGSTIYMQGGSGNTTIASSGGSSITQFGGTGNDSLYSSGGSSIYMQGGSGNATLSSTGGSSITQFGGSGNDSLYSSGGSSIYMQGGTGNATLSSSGGSSITQFGGSGNDSLYSSGGSSVVMQGGSGNSTLSSSGGSSITQFGGSGNDSIVSTGGSSIYMQGGSGNSTLSSSGGSSITQFGGSGNDSLYTSGGSSIYMQGGTGNTTLSSTGGSSITQFGGSGNDSLYTSGGSSIYMQGGSGNSTLSSTGGSSITQFGGSGNDSIVSSGGSSIYMQGGSGNSTLSSSGGSSITQFGGSGNDSLYSSGGSSIYMQGGGGNSTLASSGGSSITQFGGTGNDSLYSSGGSSVLMVGGTGNSTLSNSGGGSITQFGGTGNDSLYTSGGSSIYMQGGSGNVTLSSTGGSSITQFGGSGNDSLYSSGGSSIYMQGGSGNSTLSSSGDSSITQFGGSGNDSLSSSGGSSVLMVGGSGNTTLSSSGGSSITQFGGSGNDSLSSTGGSSIYLQGGSGNSTLTSTGGSSITQFGGSGNDSLSSTAGNTLLMIGGTGTDNLNAVGAVNALVQSGGATNDFLTETGGSSVTLLGGAGNDTLLANGGTAIGLAGLDGDNTYELQGNAANPLSAALNDLSTFGQPLTGADGATQGTNTILFPGLTGGIHLDLSNASPGTTPTATQLQNVASGISLSLTGQFQNVVGGPGNNWIHGGAANNVLQGGGSGNDTLLGGTGPASLLAGSGNDSLVGGSGGTVYRFAGSAFGNDTVAPASSSSDDTLDFSQFGGPVNLNITSSSAQTVNNTNGLTLTLANPLGITGVIDNASTTPYNDAVTGNSRGDVFTVGTGNDTFTGAGGDSFYFGGTHLGSDVLNEAAGTQNTLNFLAFGAPINLNLAQAVNATAVSPGNLTLTLSNPSAFSTVVGTSYADDITGNNSNDTLLGAGGDDSLMGGSGSNYVQGYINQVVYLDFPTSAAPGDLIYTPTEISDIVAALKSDYSGFNYVFTQDPNQAAQLAKMTGGQFATLQFGTGQSGGAADQLDPDNLHLGGSATIDITSFLGQASGQVTPSLTNILNLTATIAAHELGHLSGLQHQDAFGPIGSGIYSGVNPDLFFPFYTGPADATETPNDVMASPASMGTTLQDAAGQTYLGERDLIKLAFNDTGTILSQANLPSVQAVKSNPTGNEIVLPDAGTVYQLGNLPALAVPDTLPTGVTGAGQTFAVTAAAVNATIQTGQVQYYAFQGSAGELMSFQVISSTNTLNTQSILPALEVLDQSGNLVSYAGNNTQTAFYGAGAVNQHEFESNDSSLYDVTLPSTGTYYIGVTTLPISPSGNYQLFTYSFGTAPQAAGDTLVAGGGSGNDTLVGSSGNDDFGFLPGFTGTATIDSGSGQSTLDLSGFAANPATNLTIVNQSSTHSITLTTVSSSAASNPPVYGSAVTLTATVTNTTANGPTPTGSVTFYNNGVALGSAQPLSDGSASLTVPVLPGGTNNITANYTSDSAQFNNSVSPTFQQVITIPTTISVPSASVTSDFGQPLTLTATVAAQPPITIGPAGSVDFFDTTTQTDLGSVVLSANGTAQLITDDLPAETQTITMTFTGSTENFLSSSTTVTATIVPSIYVLNSSASGALSLSGNSTVTTPGLVVVDSSSSTALVESGNDKITASGIDLVGSDSIGSNSSLSTTPTHLSSADPDPLANLPIPSATGLSKQSAVNLSGNSKLTISQGIYTSIKVSGSASLTLNPGIYVIAGGGFAVTGNASVTGAGVLIYNAGSNYNGGSGSSFGGLTLSGNGINLSAAATGPYAGIVLFQSRDNTRAISLSGNGAVGLGGGIVYAPSALLSMSGNVQLGTSSSSPVPLIVNELKMTGNVSSDMTADGTDNSSGSNTAGQLLAGDVTVYVDDSSDDFTTDELTRIQDAVNSANATVSPFGVSVTEVDASQSAYATTTITLSVTSPAGSAADGVLGCESSSGITLVSGWNWYAGADPSAVGSGQYDFETVVLHELGHALGLGHSPLSSSVMYATLDAGATKRALAVADLNIPDSDSGPCALHAAVPSVGKLESRFLREMPPTPELGPQNSVPIGQAAPTVSASNTGWLRKWAWLMLGLGQDPDQPAVVENRATMAIPGGINPSLRSMANQSAAGLSSNRRSSLLVPDAPTETDSLDQFFVQYGGDGPEGALATRPELYGQKRAAASE